MTSQRVLLVLGSFFLGIFLIAALAKVSRVSLEQAVQQIRNVHWLAFVAVILLNFVLVFISTEKWRAIDDALRSSADAPQNRSTSFALTSAGLAIGTLLPVQIAMSTTRTLGTHGNGSSLKRGTAGTLYEQSFDVLITILLAAASAATWFLHGSTVTWSLAAMSMLAAALLGSPVAVWLIRWCAALLTRHASGFGNRTRTALENLAELLQSGIFGVSLARRLVLLSYARFVVVVLMSVGTAEAIGVHIPLWKMAASIPFVAVSSLIALTPGGLGINEMASVAALRLFGIPLLVSGQWAIANRVLITLSYFVVAICAFGILSIRHLNESVDRSGVKP